MTDQEQNHSTTPPPKRFDPGSSPILYSRTHSVPQAHWRHWNDNQGFNSLGHQYSISGSPQSSSMQYSRMASLPHHHAKLAAIISRTQNADKETVHSLFSDTTRWTALDLGGMAIRNVSRPLYTLTFLTTLYLNHNLISYISPDIEQLKNLEVLHLSSNRIRVLPPEMGRLYNLKELLLFDNLLATLPLEFGYLHRLELLGLDGNPWDGTILSVMQKDGPVGVIKFLRDQQSRDVPSPERPWISMEDGLDRNLVILSYNILANSYVDVERYGYAPSWALEWDYRKARLIREICKHGSDIVCLQELEYAEYNVFLQAFGTEYEGAFVPKSRFWAMTEQERKTVDGCAVFYRRSKLCLQETIPLDFSRMAMEDPRIVKSDDLYNRVVSKDNVGMLCRMEWIQGKTLLLVGNVHLYWNPEYQDVKLVQTLLLVDKMLEQRAMYKTMEIVLAGDLNSLPGSGVYEYLSLGKLAPTHPDFNKCTYEPFTTSTNIHMLKLKDCYQKVSGELVTNYTSRFSGAIDYIWYSNGSEQSNGRPGLTLCRILGGIPLSQLNLVPGWPSPCFPSDHIPLVAEFHHPVKINKPSR